MEGYIVYFFFFFFFYILHRDEGVRGGLRSREVEKCWGKVLISLTFFDFGGSQLLKMIPLL